MIHNIIFDFDSTLINAEGNELLIAHALGRLPEKEKAEKLEQMQTLTRQCTNGEIPLTKAMSGRYALTQLEAEDVDAVSKAIVDTINPKIKEALDALRARDKNIFVYSTSPEQVVLPVTDALGITRENVFTTHLQTKDDGTILGIQEDGPLCMTLGKVYVSEQLKSQERLTGPTAIIGDGVTDLAVKKNGIAEMFVYYAGTIDREDIRLQADFTIDNFDQLLPLLSSTEEYQPQAKDAGLSDEDLHTPNVFLLENVHNIAIERLNSAQYNVASYQPAWSEQELIEKALHANVMGIRSKTKLTANVLNHLKDLWVIGAFCIGTNQIDLETATAAGIPVFNAPYSNTRSVAELVVGETIMLMRRTFEKSAAAHSGKWLKQADGCSEIRGKTVGIVGYGHIGSQVSIMLENLGMTVLFHDIVDKLPLGNAQKVNDLYDLLERSDVVTLHVPDTLDTRGLIGEKELVRMKRGSYLINASRGRVVDIEPLHKLLEYGHIAGAAVDVFPAEPASTEEAFQSPLQGMPNVILTPHIGGSTLEAQENIARYVSEKMISFVKTGSTMGSVNFPEVELPRVDNTHRILHIHKNVPGVLAKINSVFARRNINVEGQILQTRDTIGYLIVDVDRDVSHQVFEIMKHITETVQVRRIL